MNILIETYNQNDWDQLNITNVNFISDEGEFGTVVAINHGNDDFIYKLGIPSNFDHVNDLRDIALREAKVGFVINTVNELKTSFVQTVKLIQTKTLPESIKKTLSPNRRIIYESMVAQNMIIYIIVQEYIKNSQTLASWAQKQNNGISDEIIKNISFQLVLSLSIANAEVGFQHNDLKEGNIMVTEIQQQKEIKKISIGGDLFEVIYPVGCPHLKIIDFGASIIRLPGKNKTPLGTSAMISGAPTFDIIFGDDLEERENSFDTLSIFKIILTLILHNKWTMPDNNKWIFKQTPSGDDTGVIELETGYSVKETNKIKTMIASDIDDFYIEDFLSLVSLRKALKITEHDKTLMDIEKKIANNTTKNPFDGIDVVVDNDKYRLMFLQKLFGVLNADRLEFGVVGSHYGLANALYHPYFSIKSYYKGDVGNTTVSMKINDVAEPIEYQIKSSRVDKIIKFLMNLKTQDVYDTSKDIIPQTHVSDTDESSDDETLTKDDPESEESSGEEETRPEEDKKTMIADINAYILELFGVLENKDNKIDLKKLKEIIAIGAQNGKAHNIRSIVLETPIKEYDAGRDDDEEHIKDDFLSSFEDAFLILDNNDDLIQLDDSIFQSNRGKWSSWKIKRAAAVFIYFIGSYKLYLEDNDDNITKNGKIQYTEVPGKINALGSITSGSAWDASFDINQLNDYRNEIIKKKKTIITTSKIPVVTELITIRDKLKGTADTYSSKTFENATVFKNYVTDTIEEVQGIISDDIYTDDQKKAFSGLNFPGIIIYKNKRNVDINGVEIDGMEMNITNEKYTDVKTIFKMKRYLYEYTEIANYAIQVLSNSLINISTNPILKNIKNIQDSTDISELKTYV